MHSVVDPEIRARIEDFLAAYAHRVDDDEIERWPEFFTEDAVYRVIPRDGYAAGHRVGVMSCHGRGMMIDRVKALREANIYEPHRYCHLLGRSEITGLEDGSFAVRTNLTVARTMPDGATVIFVTGKYVDRIEMLDDGPRIAERSVVIDSHRIDTLLVFPL